MTADGLRFLLIAFFSAVLALFVIAPFAEPHGSLAGLDGNPISPDNFDIWVSLNPLSAAAYAAGDILCHQMESRSFMLNGSQMPVCSRDASALAGVVAGLLLSAPFGRALSKSRVAIPLLVASFALMAADVAIQSSFALNVLPARVATGFACGFSAALVVDMWIRSIWEGG